MDYLILGSNLFVESVIDLACSTFQLKKKKRVYKKGVWWIKLSKKTLIQIALSTLAGSTLI